MSRIEENAVVYREIQRIVGDESVSTAIEDLITYSRDESSPLFGSREPDLVVMPASLEETRAVLRLAYEHRVAVKPHSFGTNTTGTALSAKGGGIILDLRRLDRILEIDGDSMTATIEPGVCWRRLDKEARKHGLRTTFAQGPYSGGPIGNFVNGPVSPYATRYSPDRMVSLEVVLSNGEILRTGSAGFPSHEALNPYFRYAYGPDLTGLFRGSLGTLGVITKAVYQLFPVGEAEEMISAGFADLESALGAVREIERADITKSAMITTREMLVKLIIPDVENLKNEDEVGKLMRTLPRWCVSVGLCGTRRQVTAYARFVNDLLLRHRGSHFLLHDEYRANFDDFAPGGSLKINRAMTPEGAIAWLIAIAPEKVLPDLRRATLEKMKELEIRNPVTGNFLEPPVWCFPYDRGRNFYFEQDVSYDPQDADTIGKIKIACSELNNVFRSNGSASLVVVPSIARRLDAAYVRVLKSIKSLLDPAGILSPGHDAE